MHCFPRPSSCRLHSTSLYLLPLSSSLFRRKKRIFPVRKQVRGEGTKVFPPSWASSPPVFSSRGICQCLQEIPCEKENPTLKFLVWLSSSFSIAFRRKVCAAFFHRYLLRFRMPRKSATCGGHKMPGSLFLLPLPPVSMAARQKTHLPISSQKRTDSLQMTLHKKQKLSPPLPPPSPSPGQNLICGPGNKFHRETLLLSFVFPRKKNLR